MVRPDDPRRGSDDREALMTELRYLKDPLKLADHVRLSLRNGDFDKTQELVRLASKNQLCTVSWNHLVNYQLSEGKLAAALKTYNEMKKRGQTPDGHTYTVLLRGLGMHAHYPHALAKALSIYHSMHAPNSPVLPSIIHTNAVLKVCARAQDMDAMWGIAAKLPDTGMGAPDSWTYTTLINALRENAIIQAGPQESFESRVDRREKAILEAKRLWDDVVDKWRAGKLQMDEDLACAMGRLLLTGNRPMDWDDVLSLIEQTMQLPRMVPRLGSLARPQGQIESSGARAPTDRTTDPTEEEEGQRLFTPIHTSSAPADRRKKIQVLSFAQPWRNTLSLVIEACLRMHNKSAATAYWDLLTDRTGYAIDPDLENYNMYLRLLRLMRASGEASELLAEKMVDDPNLKVVTKSFRIVMSTCQRDKKNPNSFRHATRVLELMEAKLADPDVTTLISYIDLAASTDNMEKLDFAVRRIRPIFQNVRSMLNYGRASDAQMPSRQTQEDVVELAQRLIGCYDRLLREFPTSGERNRDYRRMREMLATIVTKFHHRGKSRPQGRRRPGRTDDEDIGVEQ
ncbi:MAG: hypothetical protein M1817_002874 [Caeruleum heppii]|nr:MAG: hypothetical protein M1817_002874 [Caeruleum heppii]